MTGSTRVRPWAAAILCVALVLACSASAMQGTATNTPVNAIKWQPYAPGTPLQIAVLWGDRTKPVEYGMYLKMPAGFEAGRHAHTNAYHGVAVQGTWVHTNDGGKPVELAPGGYVYQPGKQMHNDVCKGPTECILLIHQMGPGDFIPAK